MIPLARTDVLILDKVEPLGYNFTMEDKELIAYAAGIFDGEGSIYLSRRYNGTLIVKVVNTDRRLCQLFSDRWGGTVYEIESKVSNHKTIYRWSLYGKKAKPFLLDIQPYLIHKADLLVKGLEYISLLTWKHRNTHENFQRQILVDDIYDLNSSFFPRGT